MSLKESLTQISVSVGVGLLFLIVFVILDANIWRIGAVIAAMSTSFFWSLFNRLDKLAEKQNRDYESKHSGEHDTIPEKNSEGKPNQPFVNDGKTDKFMLIFTTLQVLVLIFSVLMIIPSLEKFARLVVLPMSITLILMAVPFKDINSRFFNIICYMFIMTIDLIGLIL